MSENKTAYFKQMRERMVIGDIMKEMLQCSTEEVDTIIRMVDLHGIEVIEAARVYVNNSIDWWSFGAFVVGTQWRVIERIRDRISPGMATALGGIVLDGGIYGKVLFVNNCDAMVAELFVDMCVNGTVEERIGELISYDVQIYGGREDEPDMDRLMDGLVAMMEGHGIRGDVRAKAKEFLATVATDALNEVIHEDESA